MKSMLRMMLVAAAATLMVTGAFAQTKTAPPTAPKGAKPANQKAPTAVPPKAPPKAPMGDKFWGITTKDPVKDGKFVFGSADPKKKGQFTVDTKGARITDKSGKFFSVNNIKPGSSVTVMGKATGMNIKATSVTVNSVPGAKPAAVKPAPPKSSPGKAVSKAGSKPPIK